MINADPDVQREMELVIRQLDIRRPQVLVEGIIVEMSDTEIEEILSSGKTPEEIYREEKKA